MAFRREDLLCVFKNHVFCNVLKLFSNRIERRNIENPWVFDMSVRLCSKILFFYNGFKRKNKESKARDRERQKDKHVLQSLLYTLIDFASALERLLI